MQRAERLFVDEPRTLHERREESGDSPCIGERNMQLSTFKAQRLS